MRLKIGAIINGFNQLEDIKQTIEFIRTNYGKYSFEWINGEDDTYNYSFFEDLFYKFDNNIQPEYTGSTFLDEQIDRQLFSLDVKKFSLFISLAINVDNENYKDLSFISDINNIKVKDKPDYQFLNFNDLLSGRKTLKFITRKMIDEAYN